MSDLRILITAGLNIGDSIGDINTAIKALSKHKSLQKLNLKIDVDESFVKSINKFIDSTNKLNVALVSQNKVVQETITEHRKLDGSIQKTTRQILNNGEIINKTKIIHDANKKAISLESQGYEAQIKTLQQLEKELVGYALAKTKANKDAHGQVSSYSNTYQNDLGQKINVRTDPTGKVKNYDEVTNYLQQQKDQLEAEKTINKQREQVAKEENAIRKAIQDKTEKEQAAHYKTIEALDKAHYQALKTDRERKEVLEKTHYLALQQNEKREQQYRKSLIETETKIADIRRRFGNDSSVSSGLSNIEGQLGQIKTNGSIGDFKSKFDNLNSQLKQVSANAKTATSHTIGFGEALKTAMSRFPIWMAAATMFYAPIRSLQSGVQYVYELDTAMTNLQKVTDNTASEYKEFIGDAQGVANAIGGLTLDVVKSTTEWARLGYTINQAKALAKETLVYQNVGDIDTAEQASEALIATIKGFGVEVDTEGENIANIVDIYNEVGNKFAISSQGIGEAMKRSAASLSVAGNTIEQSVAMITAANTTVQDPAKVGNALKTISMRLRGISEEGEDLSNLFPSLEEKFASVGLTLKKNDNTFKSTYDIFNDLSAVWERLSDFQQAEFVELIAGKQQGNIAASMIASWKDAQGSLEAGLNSFGSAAKENEKYLESMQGHLALFKNSVNSFWSDSISSEFLKSLIDTGTSIIKMLDNLGNATALAAGILLTFKSKAMVGLVTGAYQSVTALFATKGAIDVTAASATKASIALTGMQRALGIFGLLVTAGSLVYSIFNQINDQVDKNNKLIEDNTQKYDKLKSELENVASYYKQNYELILSDSSVKEELFQLQNQLIDTYGKEAENIDLVNGKYDDQIKKLQELSSINLDNQIKDTQILVDALNEQKYSSPSFGSAGSKMWFGTGEQSYKIGDGGGFGDKKLKEYYEELDDLLEKVRNHEESIFNEALMPKNAQEWDNALNRVQEKIDQIKPQYDQLIKLDTLRKQKIESTLLTQRKFNEEQQQLFKSLSTAISNQPLETYENSLKEIASITKTYDGTNLESVLIAVKEISSISLDSSLISNLENLKTKVESVTDAFGDLSNADYFKKLGPQIENTKKDIQLLNTAQKELKETNHLSVETMNKMNSSYADFVNVAGSSKEELMKFVTAKKEEKQVFIDTEKEKTKALIASTNASIVAYKIANSLLPVPIPEAVYESAEKRLKELQDRLGILDSYGRDLVYKSDEVNREQQKSNETISVTNELLTEQQKRMRELQLATEKLQNKRNRFKKGSEEYQKSIMKENKLLEEQKKIYEEAIKNPEILLSTKVTTTSKINSESGSTNNSGVSSLISNALNLQGNFNYKQVSGEYKGSFDEFVKGATSDCSQFVQEMFKEFLNIKLPRTAAEQAKQGTSVSKSELQPGDLVFFNTTGKANSHVGIYTGNGKFIQMGTQGLKEQDLNSKLWTETYKYEGARRIGGASSSPATSEKSYSGKYADPINKYAKQYGVDPYLVAAVIQTESSFNPNNVSKAGAKGLMQLMPKTAASLGVKDSFDPDQNIQGGVKYLKQLLDQFNGDVELALMAYNGGPTKINKWKNNGSVALASETKEYAPKVLSNYNKLNNSPYEGFDVLSQKYKYTPPSQSEIEQARLDSEQKRDQIDNQIYQNKIAFIDGKVANSERKLDTIDRNIEKSKIKQSKNPETSAEWRKEELSQISYLTKKQEELSKQNDMLDKLIKEKQITSGEYDERKAKNSMEWLNIKEQKQQKTYAVFTSSLNEIDEQIQGYGNKIDISNAKLSTMTEGTDEYNKELLSQIPLVKEQQKLADKSISTIEEQLKKEKLTSAQKEELKERLHQLTIEQLNYNAAIKDTIALMYSMASGKLTDIFENIKGSLDLNEVFDVEQFNDSIDSIIASFDKIDGVFKEGVSFVDTSSQARSELQDYSNRIKDIAQEVKSALNYSVDLNNVSFSNLSSLGSQITSQIHLIGSLKNEISKMNDVIRDTELQYRRNEEALEETIKSTEKSYDIQIQQQQELLKNLDEQIEKEDRIKRLQEINDELNKVKNDKRFSYVTEAGEEILTYDKARVEELEKQKDELVKQYEREDVKNAIQDEIDRLQKQKQDTVQILQEKLDKTKQINQQSLESMKLYQSNLSSLYSQTVTDTQSKLSEFETALQKGLEDGSISAEEGSKLLEFVVNEWQASSLQKWDSYVTQVSSKLAELQSMYAQMASLAASMNSMDVSSKGNGNSTNSSGNASFSSSSGSFTNSSNVIHGTVTSVTKKKYHTGGEVGKEPLAPNEYPAILEMGELVLNKDQIAETQKRLSFGNLINSSVSALKNMVANVKINTPTLATNQGTHYSFSGDITIKANNPMELFKGLETHIASNRR